MLELWQENTHCLQSWVASNNLTSALPRPHYVGDFLKIVVQLAQSFGGLGIPVLCVLPQQVNCRLQMTMDHTSSASVRPSIFVICRSNLMKKYGFSLHKHVNFLNVWICKAYMWLLWTQTCKLRSAMLQWSQCETCSPQILPWSLKQAWFGSSLCLFWKLANIDHLQCFLKLGDTTQLMSFRGGPFVLWAPSRKRVLLILWAILARSTIVAAFFTMRGFQSHAICMNQSWICQIWGWFKNQNVSSD